MKVWLAGVGVLAGAGCAARLVGAIEPALWFLALAHIVLGVGVFVHHGRQTATATGLYLLSAAVLLGWSGVVLTERGEFPEETWLILAVMLVAHGGVVAGALATGAARTETSPGLPVLGDRTITALLAAGAAYLATGLALRSFAPSALYKAFAFDGTIVLVAVGLLAAAKWRRQPGALAGWLVAGAGTAIYLAFFFSGPGRLNVASLFLVPAVVLAAWRPRAWFKWAVVAAIAPALLLAGMARLPDQVPADLGAPREVLLSGRGLVSVWIGLESFAELTAPGGASYPRQRGTTFIDALLSIVPRAWWAGKPTSLGVDLAEALHPDGPEGLSTTVLLPGEWWVNFGWLGLALSLPVMVGVLAWTDRQWLASTQRGGATGVVSALTAGLVVVGMFDLMWGGSFTFMSRTGVRVLLLLPLLAAVHWWTRSRQPAAIAS